MRRIRALPSPLWQYRNRWGIECLLIHLMRRAFNTEDTPSAVLNKLHIMLAMVVIATACAQVCAKQVQEARSHPVQETSAPCTLWLRLGMQAYRAWHLAGQRQPWKAYNTIHKVAPGRLPETGETA